MLAFSGGAQVAGRVLICSGCVVAPCPYEQAGTTPPRRRVNVMTMSDDDKTLIIASTDAGAATSIVAGSARVCFCLAKLYVTDITDGQPIDADE